MSLSTSKVKNPGGYGCKRLVWTLETVRQRCKIVGDCWIWQQGLNGSGYPVGTIDGKPGMMIRRFVLDATGRTKTANKGWRAVCTCDEPLCVSPAHLVPSTYSAIQRKVYATGVRLPERERAMRSRAAVSVQGVLTVAQVIEIRTASGITDQAFADRFGCARNTVRAARVGKTWHHVPMVQNRSIFGVAA